MVILKPTWILSFSLLWLLKGYYAADKTCNARKFGESVVCVCTKDHCDEVIREEVESGKYVAYTSSLSGSRFNKIIASMRKCEEEKQKPKHSDFIEDVLDESVTNPSHNSSTLVLNPKQTYQVIEGFGGAVTDAAAYNWKKLGDPQLQKYLVDAFFGENGIGYNMIRTTIAGSDFSMREYAFNEYPENDALLTNFTLSEEDFEYKIPMIKECMDAATDDVHIVASIWSPPVWMKNTHKYTGASLLKEEYLQTYAEYILKFIQNYRAHGIPIWAVTTGNEPLSSVEAGTFNSLGWTTKLLGKWISQNFGPTLRKKSNDTLLLICDDQRYTIPIWFGEVVENHPDALPFIDGIAVHFYGDQYTPPHILSEVSKKHPDKFIIGTEASAGFKPTDYPKVKLGAWDRAELYVKDIIEDLNYGLVGWIDWNVCLDSQGGPNWSKNYVDSTIITFEEDKEFVKQPTYYAIGHFSKFLPRGSKRIDVTEKFVGTSPIDNVAFLTPDNTIVVVLYNDGDERVVRIHLGEKEALVMVDTKSIVTVEFLNEE